MGFDSREALLCLIVPYFYCLIVWSSSKVRSISFIEVDCINRAFMTSDSHVCLSICCKVPNLDSFIHWAWSKFGQIFWIECKSEYEMLVLFKCSLQNKIFLIIPNFYLCVIWTTYEEGLCRMEYKSPNKIGVSVKWLYLLSGVIVKYSDLKIIWAADYPMLLWDEFDCSDWESWCLKCFYWSLHMWGDTFVE